MVDVDNIQLPGSLDDDEEESPYLRRQKAVAVRRRFSKKLRGMARGTLIAFVTVLSLGYACYSFLSFGVRSPRFRLASADDVEIKGSRYVSREEVLNALGLPTSEFAGHSANIFRLSLEENRNRVESIPWVRSATVARAYPNHLLLHITERDPVAFVNIGGHVKLVDAEGVWLETPEKGIFDFPVLRGLEVQGSAVGPRDCLALYLDFNRQLASEISAAGWLVSEIDLADPEDLKALLVQKNDTIQVHFGNKDFLGRFRNFLVALPEARKTHSKIDSVDLRFGGQVIISPADAAKEQARSRSDPQ